MKKNKNPKKKFIGTMMIPVFSINNEPLMPTTQWRAGRWIDSGKAMGFWKKGVFCVRLRVETQNKTQSLTEEIIPDSNIDYCI